jgi:riboflavin biosynthesis pyrimidine reductase
LNLTQLLPEFRVFERLTPEQQSWQIAQSYGVRNGFRLNFVVNQDFKFVDESFSSNEISSGLDRLLLGKLRSQADLIVTTGETARREHYKSSKHAPIAIITRSGELDSVPAVQGTQYATPLIVFPQSCSDLVEGNLEDVDVRFVAYDDDQDAIEAVKAIIAELSRLGFQSPILETGPTTSDLFIAAGEVSEICLTITRGPAVAASAKLLAQQALTSIFKSAAGFRLETLFVTDREIFSRWVS